MAVFAEAPNQTPAAAPSSTPAPVAVAPVSTVSPSAGNSSATVSNSPSTGNSASTAAPSTGNSSGTLSNTPSTGGSSATTGPSTGNSQATVTATPTPTATPVVPSNPSTPTNTSGSSSSGGSSSSSGSRIGYSCNFITSFMKYGAKNDSVQVTRLQTFLRDIEKLNVDVNGIFDRKTENAVIAFQNKYSQTVMGPWKESKGTGFVYITTIKQINKIACNQPLTLNTAELAIINASNNRKIASTNNSVIVVPPATNKSPVIEVQENEGNTITFEEVEVVGETNVATVTKSSVMNRFWNFLVYLFK